MGNWEYQCHVGSIKYAPIHVVVKAIGKGTLAKWVENMRASIGFRLIDRKGKESTTSQIFQALNKKEIIYTVKKETFFSGVFEFPECEYAISFSKLQFFFS